MSTIKTSATVRVRLEVEVTLGTWDTKTSFADLRTQAMREAEQRMRNLTDKARDVQMVGKPLSMRVTMTGDLD